MTMENDVRLRVSGLGLDISSGRRLFSGLNFSLAPGDVVFILGPNGSGKTSLLRCLMGKQEPTDGHIVWSVPKTDVVYLPQIQNDQVHAPLTLFEMIQFFSSGQILKEHIAEQGLLDTSHLDLNWNQASGGEQKRSLLASCFLRKPKVMVLDEPFNHLDRASRYQVAQLLLEFLDQGGALLLVTHEAGVVKGSGLPPAEVIQL